MCLGPFSVWLPHFLNMALQVIRFCRHQSKGGRRRMGDCGQWESFILSLETPHSTSAHRLVSQHRSVAALNCKEHLEPRSSCVPGR